MKKQTKLDEIGINYRVLMKKYAMWYAEEQGWHIIPLHHPVFSDSGEVSCSCEIEKAKMGINKKCDSVGKHPRIKEWSKNASIDRTTILSWFEQWPDMNIGIVTGSISGIVVLDADGPKGKRSLIQAPPVPQTATVKSGVGLHYYLIPPKDLYVKTLAGVMPGIDSRGEGGYVCSPCSLHKRGYRYEWLLATNPVPAPAWWLELVEKPKAPVVQEIKFDVKVNDLQIHAYGRIALENELAMLYSTPVGMGLRNDKLNKASFSLGQLVGGGILDEQMVRSCLWDAAVNGMQMESDEASKTLESGLRGGMQKPRKLVNNQ
jgi:hypothetical protein